MIKYIGSKRTLIPALVEIFGAVAPSGPVVDLFSGTSRVGHALKARGYQVIANDHNAYAATLAACYVQADLEDHEKAAAQLVNEFNALPGVADYFTDVFCERSRFFQPKNGARVDAIREEIERKGLHPELKAVMLVSLMEAADRIDSTTGVQMAYLKQWAARAHNNLELRVPALRPRAAAGKGQALHMEAEAAVDTIEANAFYMDPPYNQHKYLGNYHIWESLVLWDKPEVYGIACKRVDCRERGSNFNAKGDARQALKRVVQGARARHLVVSFNNEGYVSRADMEGLLAERGEVVVFAHDFKRYVGAQIGIHNLKGEKVGEVSHLRNTEYIYVASQDAAVIERVRALGARSSREVYQEDPPASNASAGPQSRAFRPPQMRDVQLALQLLLAERGSLSPAEARTALGAEPGILRAAFRSIVALGAATLTEGTGGARYTAVTHSEMPTAVLSPVATTRSDIQPVQPEQVFAPSPLSRSPDLRSSLLRVLDERREVSSEDVQRMLGVGALDLRPLFRELVTEGRIITKGQRRGTRYVWLADAAAPTSAVNARSSLDYGTAPSSVRSVKPDSGKAGQQLLFAAS